MASGGEPVPEPYRQQESIALFGPIIKLVFENSQETLWMHAILLEEYSDFIRGHINEHRRSSTSQVVSIQFDEDAVPGMRAFTQAVYHAELSVDTLRTPGSTSVLADLIEIYIFADFYGMPILKDAVAGKVWYYLRRHGQDFPTPTEVETLYNHTAPSDAMRRLLVDTYLEKHTDTFDSDEEPPIFCFYGLETYPDEFFDAVRSKLQRAAELGQELYSQDVEKYQDLSPVTAAVARGNLIGISNTQQETLKRAYLCTSREVPKPSAEDFYTSIVKIRFDHGDQELYCHFKLLFDAAPHVFDQTQDVDMLLKSGDEIVLVKPEAEISTFRLWTALLYNRGVFAHLVGDKPHSCTKHDIPDADAVLDPGTVAGYESLQFDYDVAMKHGLNNLAILCVEGIRSWFQWTKTLPTKQEVCKAYDHGLGAAPLQRLFVNLYMLACLHEWTIHPKDIPKESDDGWPLCFLTDLYYSISCGRYWSRNMLPLIGHGTQHDEYHRIERPSYSPWKDSPEAGRSKEALAKLRPMILGFLGVYEAP